MSAEDNRRTVERLVRALNEHDLDLFDAQFHEDSIIDYPQSGERIVGRANRRATYEAFPRLPTVTTSTISTAGELAVLEATFDYGDGVPWHAIIVFELRDGRIARERAYWAQPFEAAEWRAEWVERVDG